MFAFNLLFAALTATQLPDGWRFARTDGTILLEQHAAANERAYIHPLMGPDGKGVYTENRPPHHPWQHGLYTGLHAVNGINFWEKEQGQFHPDPIAKPMVKDNEASWTVKTHWTKPTGEKVLVETQAWTLHDHGTNYVLDLTWTLDAEVDITFGKWAYGGLFIRMPFKQENRGRQWALNSRGQRNNKAEQQVAEWCEVSMPIAGRDQNGVVRIEDQPGNPGYPNPWRVDGQLGIAPSPCIRGPRQQRQGEKYINRYRVTVR